MVELKNNELIFHFPEVHDAAVCKISFQRTLRIPDDNRKYPLPPGLGKFPIAHVEDHSSRLPPEWSDHGGVLLPMHQAEAMWIKFPSKESSYPFAIKVATGKINAITGKNWHDQPSKNPQDYLIAPDQPWLDGYCVQKGLIRQFVAMPLGSGYSAEEQISGEAVHGGIQIVVYPMKRHAYEEMQMKNARAAESPIAVSGPSPYQSASMGLAPGGLMRQKIYKDHYGFDVWDVARPRRCFVHILNSSQWTTATGRPTPTKPLTAAQYTNAGLPWFEHYDERLCAIKGAKKLAELDGVEAKAIKLGENVSTENVTVNPKKVVQLGRTGNKVVDGKW